MLTKEEIQDKLKNKELNYSEIARETGLTNTTIRNVRDKGKCNNMTRKALSEYFKKTRSK